jgi:hypothetical protein
MRTSQSDRMLKQIQSIWATQTSESGGYFCRHIDGNTLNNNIINLQWVHPCDAFKNPDWKVDWICDLSNKQINFVKNNLQNFIDIYS